MLNKCSSHAHGDVHGTCVPASKRQDHWNYYIYERNCSTSVVWIHIKGIFPGDMVSGAMYLPCETSEYFSDDIFQNLISDLAFIEGKFKDPILQRGYLNARTSLLSEKTAEDIVTWKAQVVFGVTFVFPLSVTDARHSYRRLKILHATGEGFS